MAEPKEQSVDILIPLSPTLPPLEKKDVEVEKVKAANKNKLRKIWENEQYGGVFHDWKPKMIEVLEHEEDLHKEDPEAMRILSEITTVKHLARENAKLIENTKAYLEDNELGLSGWNEVTFVLDRNLTGMIEHQKALKLKLKNLKDQKNQCIGEHKKKLKQMEIQARITVHLQHLELYEQRNNVTEIEYETSISHIEAELEQLRKLGCKPKKGTKGLLEKWKRRFNTLKSNSALVDEELNNLMNMSFNSQGEEFELDEQQDSEMQDHDPSPSIQEPPRKKARVDVYALHRHSQPEEN